MLNLFHTEQREAFWPSIGIWSFPSHFLSPWGVALRILEPKGFALQSRPLSPGGAGPGNAACGDLLLGSLRLHQLPAPAVQLQALCSTGCSHSASAALRAFPIFLFLKGFCVDFNRVGRWWDFGALLLFS